MCIRPLSKENLEKMHQFKYKYKNDSILSNCCISPFLNIIIKCLPKALTPNLISLFLLIYNLIAFFFTVKEGWFDFSLHLQSSTCFIIGFSHLFYLIIDNLYGKQAKIMDNSTPFSILMVYGCDIFTNIIMAYNLTKLLIIGNEYFDSFSVFFGIMLGFYMMTYENYKVGEMYFPPINWVDEGNFAMFIIGVVCGFIGQDWLNNSLKSIGIAKGTFLSEFSFYNLQFGNMIGKIITTLGIITWAILYLHTYQKKGCLENIKTFFDNISFYCCIFVPIIYIYYKEIFYYLSKWILIINSCLMFARVTLDLQIKIVTMDAYKCNFVFVFSNIIFISSIFINNYQANLYILVFLAIFQIVELVVFIFVRSREITDYLGIHIFFTQPLEQK